MFDFEAFCRTQKYHHNVFTDISVCIWADISQQRYSLKCNPDNVTKKRPANIFSVYRSEDMLHKL